MDRLYCSYVVSHMCQSLCKTHHTQSLIHSTHVLIHTLTSKPICTVIITSSAPTAFPQYCYHRKYHHTPHYTPNPQHTHNPTPHPTPNTDYIHSTHTSSST